MSFGLSFAQALAASLRPFFFGYPLSWEEQSILFSELPAHLQIMAMFKVNTGCREQEVCKLQWDWEIAVPELGTSVFLIPAGFGGRSERSGVKNRDERLVILNSVAKSIIEKRRGQHKHFVLPFGMPGENGNPTMIHRMNDSAWKRARIRATKK
ncbi:integrase [Pseudomonas sp. JAI111]|nr:integrase [Pseudomonas sp. JAI111]